MPEPWLIVMCGPECAVAWPEPTEPPRAHNTAGSRQPPARRAARSTRHGPGGRGALPPTRIYVKLSAIAPGLAQDPITLEFLVRPAAATADVDHDEAEGDDRASCV